MEGILFTIPFKGRVGSVLVSKQGQTIIGYIYPNEVITRAIFRDVLATFANKAIVASGLDGTLENS